jgi:hypothetical protein
MDNNVMTAPAEEAVGTIDATEEFYTHRSTPEEHASAKWAEERNRDIDANRAIKQALGQGYDGYRRQLEELSSDERAGLLDKSAEEIAEDLDIRAEADRHLRALEKQAREQAEANSEPIESPHLREVRKAMKTAYKEVATLDDRIAELHRLNELRDDPSAEGWDGLPAEQWKAAREGKMESFNSDLANLIQEKQAKLQEATLHQNAYHEVARTTTGPAPNMPIGQFVGNDGQPMQITKADIAGLVQLERDDQAHLQRAREAMAENRYPDWDHHMKNMQTYVGDIRPQEAALIKSLPNSVDVVYYLITHPSETVALQRMSSHEVTRALIEISHKAARPGGYEAPRTTRAPKPPSPVSGSSRGVFDVNDESVSADTWFARRNADLKRRGKS